MSAISFTSHDAKGDSLSHYCRIGPDLLPDDPELLAQGRVGENACRKRDYNRLPSFESYAAAKTAFEQGRIPGRYGSWFTWQYRIDPLMDAFRADYRDRQGHLAAQD